MRDSIIDLRRQPVCRIAFAALFLLANASTVLRAQDHLPQQQPAMPGPQLPAAPGQTAPSVDSTPVPPAAIVPAQPSAGTSPADPAATPSLDPAAASQRVTSAPATLPHDLSPWGMFMQADIVVKAVMIGLAFASFVTWTVWIAKALQLAGAKRRARSATRKLQRADSLADATSAIEKGWTRNGSVADLVHAAARELQRSPDLSAEGIKERLAIALSRIEAGAGREVTRGTGLLATIGATAPFVGLFGTVWGIMNSFIGISQTKTTNLAVVAPGIAEALLATALGLVAAIPAVIIYNVFARAIAGYRAILSDASGEILQHLSRDLERSEKVAGVNHALVAPAATHPSAPQSRAAAERSPRAAPSLLRPAE